MVKTISFQLDDVIFEALKKQWGVSPTTYLKNLAICEAYDEVGHVTRSSNLTIRTTEYNSTFRRDFDDIKLGPTIPAESNHSANFTVSVLIEAIGTAENIRIPIEYEIKDLYVKNVQVTDENGSIVPSSTSTTAGITTVSFNTSTFNHSANFTYYILYKYDNETFRILYYTEGVYRYLNITQLRDVTPPTNYINFSIYPTSTWDSSSQHVKIEVYQDGQWADLGNFCQGDDFSTYGVYNVYSGEYDDAGNKKMVNISVDASHRTEKLIRFSIIEGGERSCSSSTSSSSRGGGSSSGSLTSSISTSNSKIVGNEKVAVLFEGVDTFFKGKTAGISNALLSIASLGIVLTGKYYKEKKFGSGSLIILIGIVFIGAVYLPYLVGGGSA